MFISIAHAASEVGSEVAQPNMADAFMTNMGLIALMFILFYVIMIRPQQKRMKQERELLGGLKKGDAVQTAGGLLGTVSKVVDDEQVEIDLGGVKVTALRYSLHVRGDEATPLHKPSNDAEPAKKDTKPAAAKKATAKKAPAAKKTAAKK